MISTYLVGFSIIFMVAIILILRKTQIQFSRQWRITGGIAAIIGLVLTILGGMQLEKSFGMRSWDVVTGKIIASEVIGERAKRPRVTYKYSIAESEFEGVTDLDQPSFGGRNQRRSTANIKASLYSIGDTVTVFVNPDNPQESTLRPHPFWSEYAQAGFGLFLLMFGGAVLFGRYKA